MKIAQIIKEEVVPLSRRQHIVLILIIACVFQFLLFFAPTLAEAAVRQDSPATASGQDEMISLDSLSKVEATSDQMATTTAIAASSTPAIKALTASSTPKTASSTKVSAKIKRETQRVITAYTSEAAQTDSDPCTTANGFNVCNHAVEDTIAANWLPIGAKVKIPDLFGDRIFTVRDRMNSKHADQVDVWMVKKADALQFGRKIAKIQVLE